MKSPKLFLRSKKQGVRSKNDTETKQITIAAILNKSNFSHSCSENSPKNATVTNGWLVIRLSLRIKCTSGKPRVRRRGPKTSHAAQKCWALCKKNEEFNFLQLPTKRRQNGNRAEKPCFLRNSNLTWLCRNRTYSLFSKSTIIFQLK